MPCSVLTTAPNHSRRPNSGEDSSRLTIQAVTLMLWLFCGTVSLIGLCWDPKPRPHSTVPPLSRPQSVQLIQIELSEPAPAVRQPAQADSTSQPKLQTGIHLDPAPAAMQAIPPLSLPGLTPLISPTKPLDGISSKPEKAPALSSPSVGPAADSPSLPSAIPSNVLSGSTSRSNPVVQTLVFGKGAGRQPPPDYPKPALRLRQQGSVTVRFSVDEEGRVTQALVSKASSWPLLNEAALRCVRERWHFEAGSLRDYEVSIRFELNPTANSPVPISKE